MVLWDGACMVHEKYSLEKILDLKLKHPDAELISHPECEGPVLLVSDYIGSTTGLLNYTMKSDCKQFIVATETGILHQMKKASPDKEFLIVPADDACSCNDCPYMKMNTLEKLHACLYNEQPEIKLSKRVIELAEKPILQMLKLSE